MLLLLFALAGPVIEPPEPPDTEAVSYYGSGKAQDADLTRQVLEKYEAIEKARRPQANEKPRPASAAVEAIKAQALEAAQVSAKNSTQRALEWAARTPIDAPFAAASLAAQAEDDQIMALMAMMLLED